MNSKIEQKDINNAAWAACDTFRGVVDPAQYKDYILVMLFVKYISDVWQDHYEAYQKQYGDDDERIRRRLARATKANSKGSFAISTSTAKQTLEKPKTATAA